MAIVKLPNLDNSTQVPSEVFVQIWNETTSNDLHFIPGEDRLQILSDLSEALVSQNNPPMEPFDSNDAFFAGQVFPNEMAALTRLYKAQPDGFGGFTSKIARVKDQDDNWRLGWSLVAMRKNKGNLYNGEKDLIIVSCAPFADDIPPSNWSDMQNLDDGAFGRALGEYALDGQEIANQLAINRQLT